MLSPFMVSSSPSPLPLLTYPPTATSLSWHFPTLRHWALRDQRPLLPLMIVKAILCYICSWSHGSLHVYSLVGGLVPGSCWGTGWFILLFLLWGCKPLQLLGSFSSSSIGDPVLSPMDVFEHPLLYLSGAGDPLRRHLYQAPVHKPCWHPQ
jgi:hypothetical protein